MAKLRNNDEKLTSICFFLYFYCFITTQHLSIDFPILIFKNCLLIESFIGAS